jgi:hypothetical protein
MIDPSINPAYGTKLIDPMEVVKIDSGMPKAKKPLVIYHKNCNDGFAAAWCFWDISHTAFDFHPGVYGEDPPDVTDRVVYMVDFSYSRAKVAQMCDVAKQVYLIDHHKTAIEDLASLPSYCGNFLAYVDLNRSGAMLAWDFLHNAFFINDDTGLATNLVTERTPHDHDYVWPPMLLQHIQDRDLWKFKLDGTRPIHQALSSVDMAFEVWDNLFHGGALARLNLWREGEAIERKYYKDCAAIIEQNLRWFEIGGYRVPVVNAPGMFASDIGNILAKRIYTEGTPCFAATYYDTATHRVFSLRSEGDFDVSAVAKGYGGGGHRNAAGFKISRASVPGIFGLSQV